jgi:hypothetical protein
LDKLGKLDKLDKFDKLDKLENLFLKKRISESLNLCSEFK